MKTTVKTSEKILVTLLLLWLCGVSLSPAEGSDSSRKHFLAPVHVEMSVAGMENYAEIPSAGYEVLRGEALLARLQDHLQEDGKAQKFLKNWRDAKPVFPGIISRGESAGTPKYKVEEMDGMKLSGVLRTSWMKRYSNRLRLAQKVAETLFLANKVFQELDVAHRGINLDNLVLMGIEVGDSQEAWSQTYVMLGGFELAEQQSVRDSGLRLPGESSNSTSILKVLKEILYLDPKDVDLDENGDSPYHFYKSTLEKANLNQPPVLSAYYRMIRIKTDDYISQFEALEQSVWKDLEAKEGGMGRVVPTPYGGKTAIIKTVLSFPQDLILQKDLSRRFKIEANGHRMLPEQERYFSRFIPALGQTVLYLSDGRPFYLMEKIEGMTLEELLRTSVYPNLRSRFFLAAKIAEKMVPALEMIASINRVHRDVKPENIIISGVKVDDKRNLIDPDNIRVHLIDFGLMTLIGDYESELCGTPLYMSVDAINSGFPKSKHDLDSLSLTLWQVLAFGGYPLFHGPEPDPDSVQNQTIDPLVFAQKIYSQKLTLQYSIIESLTTKLFRKSEFANQSVQKDLAHFLWWTIGPDSKPIGFQQFLEFFRKVYRPVVGEELLSSVPEAEVLDDSDIVETSESRTTAHTHQTPPLQEEAFSLAASMESRHFVEEAA